MPQVDFTLDDLKKVFATKEDLRGFATKGDLQAFATKDDLRAFATKDDLQEFATKDDLRVFATKDDVRGFATKDDVRGFTTKDDVRGIVREEIVAERVNTRQMIQVAVGEVRGDIKSLREMLEDDARAESKRLDRVDKRSLKTQKLLKAHMADVTVHGGRKRG